MLQYRFIISILCLAAILLTAVGLWRVRYATPSGHYHMDMPIADFGNEAPGGDFALLDENGQRITRADFANKYLLIFFGFTHCPDICPTQLTVIENALHELPANLRQQIAPVFISVDPQRDTPQVMREYVRRFHPLQRGLTGTAADIAKTAKAYKIYYSRHPATGDTYDVQHTSIVYLFAPDGRLLTYFTRHTSYDDMAKAIRQSIRHNAMGH